MHLVDTMPADVRTLIHLCSDVQFIGLSITVPLLLLPYPFGPKTNTRKMVAILKL